MSIRTCRPGLGRFSIAATSSGFAADRHAVAAQADGDVGEPTPVGEADGRVEPGGLELVVLGAVSGAVEHDHQNLLRERRRSGGDGGEGRPRVRRR